MKNSPSIGSVWTAPRERGANLHGNASKALSFAVRVDRVDSVRNRLPVPTSTPPITGGPNPRIAGVVDYGAFVASQGGAVLTIATAAADDGSQIWWNRRDESPG